ncbi:LysR family transcriptional regulator [Actinobacillus porcinus]|uniref:LysR family transcriptional regulator n=1 Tax=Actinobacillus porcinus TaxID=51048 RepID=UPI0023F55756|nr:LysR family transcriptional regulator [Actinobacillus porcinus]MDD7544939.1 LysR family transcriptional regulator [Actinobacillus porcinus]MDY5847793.1 LysR family transcriptional regulator [Actinobacillus porcinus]
MIDNMNELRSFIIVAQTGSFTKAAARLNVSTSALSHSMRKLEEQLKIKLFNRTTRSVATTEAGEQLFRQLLPLFESIEDNINALSTFRDTLNGTLRINGADHVFIYAIWDKLLNFMEKYPEVKLELTSDMKFTDIVAGRFDAGIRLGREVDQDMIAVRISDDMQMALVATPEYLAKNGTPQTLQDLTQHQCVCVRMPTSEGLFVWEFRSPDSQEIIKFTPHGRLVVNNNFLAKKACLSHLGLALMPKDRMAKELERGEVVELLPEYAMHYDGYHLYYPNRRQNSPLFKALVECLR